VVRIAGLSIRVFLQLIVNIVVLFILVKYGPEMLSFQLQLGFLPARTALLIAIPLHTIISCITLSSIVLGILNSLATLYIAMLCLSYTPWYGDVIAGYFSGFLITAALFRIFRFREMLNEIRSITSAQLRSLKIPKGTLLHNYALFFATLSLTLPASVAILAIVFSSTLRFEDVKHLINHLLVYLLLNIAISMIALVYDEKGFLGFELGVLSAFPLISAILIAVLALSEATTLRVSEIVAKLKPSEEERGIAFGFVKARLKYGYPRRVYGEFKQDWIRGDRKTWYWEEYVDALSIDPRKLPNKHIVITGSSGSGKSLLAKHLILEYYTKYKTKIIVLDPHNEYYVLSKFIPELQVIDASTLTLNPLELGRLSPRERAHQVSSIIMALFHLGHLQRQVLEELILKTYEAKGIYQDAPSTWSSEPPTLQDVLEICSKLMVEDEMYRKVYPYIKILADSVFSGSSIGLKNILEKPTVIALNNLKSEYVRVLYVDTFLQRILDTMYKREVSGEYLIVLDEAYTLVSREYTRYIVSRLLMESRKYGFGIVFITQHPLSIPAPIIENASIKIAFNTSEPRNLDYVSRLFSGVYVRDRIECIRHALRNLKSFNYIFTVTGLSEVLVVSEEELIKPLIEG